jgi:hypothetical protein
MIDAERDGKALSDGHLPDREIDNRARAVRRAKARMRADCRANGWVPGRRCQPNEFRWFVTLTTSPEKLDRYDDKDILRRLTNWLRNASARFGLCYVLVPERHRDGALHFHGLFNAALRAVDSGTVIPVTGGRPVKPDTPEEWRRLVADGGHVVFNLPQWDYGFTTAIGLYGEYGAAVNYVLKYVGKDIDPRKGVPERIGGRWVYSGGPLASPVDTLLQIDDFDEARKLYPGADFAIDETGDRWHVAEIPAPDLGAGPDQLMIDLEGR